MPKLQIPSLTRAQLRDDTLWRCVLNKCKDAFTKHGAEAALDDAVRLTAKHRWNELDDWIRDGLGARARAEILGLRKGRPGRRTEFLRNSAWFDAIERRRDANKPFKVAVTEALEELRSGGERLTEDTLIKAYRRHKKLVVRCTISGLGPMWLPRAGVYVLGDSLEISPKK